MFITFEGIEGCGKSTQAKKLADFLRKQNYKVLLTREPGGPKISEQIRDILLNPENEEMLPETELLLYLSSRCQHTGEWIIPALKQNEIVISDRYYDSSLAYQGAARNIDLKKILEINTFATFSLKPDITFLIDLPVEKGLDRLVKNKIDRMEKESIEFHKRVRNHFLDIAKNDTKRLKIIDGKKNIEEIHNKIKQIIIKIL